MRLTACRRKCLLIACMWLVIGGNANSSVVQATVKVDDALVGAVIEAIVRQLDGRMVEMKLETVEQQAGGFIGTGTLVIEGEDDWLGFRFRMPLDYRLVGAGGAEINIGGITASERQLPNDPSLVSKLEGEIIAVLSKTAPSVRAQLHLDGIETREAGTSYRRIDTTGVVYFGREAGQPIRIEALYDLRKNAWLYTHYWLEKTDK